MVSNLYDLLKAGSVANIIGALRAKRGKRIKRLLCRKQSSEDSAS